MEEEEEEEVKKYEVENQEIGLNATEENLMTTQMIKIMFFGWMVLLLVGYLEIVLDVNIIQQKTVCHL